MQALAAETGGVYPPPDMGDAVVREWMKLPPRRGDGPAPAPESWSEGRLADRVIAYVESFAVSQGHSAGEPIKLLPWQKRFLRCMFEESVSEAALSIARANGKSALLGAILAACVDPKGPLHAPRSVNLVVASTLSQARETFLFAKYLLMQRHDLTNRRLWSDTESTAAVRLAWREDGAAIRALSANPRGAHGLGSFSLALLDEPAQWQPNQSDKMHSAIFTSVGKQPGSRIAAIGTRPESDDHWFSVMLDVEAEGRLAQSYSVDRDTPDHQITQRSVWLKANPSARNWETLDKALRRQALLARKDTRLLREFKALRCNMGLAETARDILIEADHWESCGSSPPERSGECVWGVDIGGSASGSAVVAHWPESGRAEALLALPSKPDLRTREKKDSAPGKLYRDALADGLLIRCGNRTPDLKELVKQAVARFGAPARLACDTWKVADLKDALESNGVDLEEEAIEMRRMGWHHSGEDGEALRFLIGEKRWFPVRSRLWDWSMSRAVIQTNHVYGIRMEKRKGDDIAVATTLAAGLAKRKAVVKEEEAPAPLIFGKY
ncbi:MAG: terminase large subunit [Bryobacterales bacterium]|nr:terminase large subunit [Bryobacterales bacterium]